MAFDLRQFAEYTGQWVALREGEVVAHSEDFDEVCLAAAGAVIFKIPVPDPTIRYRVPSVKWHREEAGG